MGRNRTPECKAAIVAVLVILAGLTGCTTAIVPPQSPENPVTVCVVDYGRHASLVLPDADGSVEFEYGEWKWFALGEDRFLRVFPTLFWPTQGALGRRQLSYPARREMLAADKQAEEVFCLTVPAEAAARLRERLTARYEAARETEVYNADYEMSFVKDPAKYTGFHNSNHVLAAWLKELGCRIRGSAFFANFRVLENE